MGCIPAEACRKALDEMTVLHPKRNRSSDGICGDASHQAHHSDHNVGEAFDVTHDTAHGVDCQYYAERLRQWVLGGIEERVKYIIWNRRIFNAAISPNWRPYHGSNPHDHHMHVSILHSARANTADWWTKQEDDLTPEQIAEILARLDKIEKALYKKVDGVEKEHLNIIDAKVDELLST